ncbi:MAG TPA: UDP-N-acetylmuramate--L-alanine ligase [Cytophagaceae bacterium]
MYTEMKLDTYKNIYFLGIGGIGMSALARWFNVNGYKVSGYDKTTTVLTKKLESEGIDVHYTDSLEAISPVLSINDTLVVYTPAIPKDSVELNYFIAEKFVLLKRAEVLGLITSKMFTIAVAGTHGKTTTSSMIAHLLKSAGQNCAAFLGGITQNYNTNLLLNEGLENAVVVVEADEYDRSFLKLSPDIAVITYMESDHLDIYENDEEFVKTFNDFVRKIKPGGVLYFRNLVESGLDKSHTVERQSFGAASGDIHATHIEIKNGRFNFNAVGKDFEIKDISLFVPGFHNIENALAAVSVAKRLKISDDKIREGLGSFKGVKRRFEYILQTEKIVLIDDYAHHPTEIEAFLRSVRAVHPGKNLTAIFQPHLFSRTRDFMEDFATSLSLADQLVLLQIYPAREKPIEGISSQTLADKVKLNYKTVCTKETLVNTLSKIETDIIVLIGAGDIDQCIEPVKNFLIEKYAL